MRGSIRQRGGTYTVYWSTTDAATGKRRQHTKGGFTRKEPGRPAKGDSAREFLNGVIGDVQNGSWKPDRDLTVRDLLVDHWLPAQRSRELRPATMAQYQGVIDNWLVPRIGGVRVKALTPAMVVDLMAAMRRDKTAKGRQGLSPRSVQLAVGVLKAACAWAVTAELLGRNPIASVRRPRPDTPEMRPWSEADARTFLTATKEDRLGFAWALLLTRGLRRGELCGLRWDAIDLDGGSLRVEMTRITVDGQPTTSRPKTSAGRRSIPLDSTLVALLRGHKARQARERLAAGEAYEDGAYLVADELGRPYHPDTISAWFDARVKALELPRIRLHDTRHTAASLMLGGGVPVKVVAEMLGHASPTITLSIYAHVLPGMAEEAGAALSASLLG